MRLGEMLALSWSGVDMQHDGVVVQQTLTRTCGGGWKVGKLAKTTKSRRSIDIGRHTIAASRAYRKRQAGRRLRCGGGWQDPGSVFDRGEGSWINPGVVRKIFGCSVKRAKVTSITPQGMRHTMAPQLLAVRVHPRIV
jgi:integrase